jgi:23S rRNA pseudouridine2604 synthase
VAEPTDSVRINKFISETGACSRREADTLIAAARVTVNGAVATLGTQVSAADVVLVDGRPLAMRPPRLYIALHKPVGIESTTNRAVRDNIVDFIGHAERLFPVGRLDKDSEGLILLTNDGDIVNAVLRAEHEHEKEYVVTVDRPVTDAFLAGMRAGVPILGTVTNPCRTERVAKNVFRIVLTQGLNRQIRRMCKHFGYTVRRLQRIRIMHIQLGELPVGAWRELTRAENDRLARSLAENGQSPTTPWSRRRR